MVTGEPDSEGAACRGEVMTDELREAIRRVVNDAMPDRAADEKLMREVLAALKTIVDDNLPVRPMTLAAVQATIMKLEQRLLQE